MLANSNFIEYMNCQFQLFDDRSPVDSWECLKLKAQHKAYNLSKFHLRQYRKEINALWSMLHYITTEFIMEKFWRMIDFIFRPKLNRFVIKWNFLAMKDFQWILHEGKMVRSFLHLEDLRNSYSISQLWNGSEYVSGSEKILPTLYEFYSHLYDCTDIKSDMEIEAFLLKLEGLPTLISDFESLLGPITFEEIEIAI